MSGPNRFVVQKYANVGTKEPFTAAFLGLTDLVDAASFDPAKKVEIKNIIMEIYMDCMLPAFLSLRKIQQPDAGAGMAWLADERTPPRATAVGWPQAN